ncbi:MAG: helix-turn-helix transcriptional regulator, partial [Bacteroidetes bacterium]|nr:helix-turn-helix transcriptional regulator [Bacteroidota bacterium]
VHSQLDNPELDVSWLCKKIGLSRSQLHRKLTALTGLSAIRFIRTLRLAAAAELLKTSDQGIAEIAYQCGFSDPAYFSRKFSDVYGCSPSEYQGQSIDD